MTGQPITLVLVDDHPVFREGLRFTLSQAEDIRVIAEASDGDDALRSIEAADPDVVLMDINMPGLDGLAATRELALRGPRPRVLMLTMYDDDANVLAAMKAGALGYLLKGADPDQVLSAVRAVASGNAVFGASLAERMLGFFTAREARSLESFEQLSAREKEVLTHLAEGLTNQQIGEALFISPITVRNHVSSILTKLQVTNRREAMIRARDAGRP